MLRVRILLLLLAASACAPPTRRAPEGEAGRPRALAIIGVSVVDVREGRTVSDQTVLVRGERIVAIGPRGSVAVPTDADRIDGQGRFVMPGLWDMHVHLSYAGRESLEAFLRHGITGVRDMGGTGPIIAWRDSVAGGALRGPRIVAAGPVLESARWIQFVTERDDADSAFVREIRSRLALATPEDAVVAVDAIQRTGADFAKIRNYPPGPAYFALARTLRARGVRLAGHAPPLSAVGIVSDSGMGSFEHSVLAAEAGGLREAFSTLSDSARRALMQRLARNGTAWTPTIVTGLARSVPDSTWRRMLADSLGAKDSRMRDVAATLRDNWRDGLRMRATDPDTSTDWATIESASARQARAMRDAGVVILAGTDVGVLGIVPGWSLHEELEMLVRRGGLSPTEALRAATMDAAAVAGLAGQVDEVVMGQAADLVLLDANPLVDVAATRRIRAVVLRGAVLPRHQRPSARAR